MTESNELIPLDDAIAIAGLLGEIAGLQADVTTRKRFLMRRLKTLTAADGWLWSMTYADHSKNQPMSVSVIHEDLTDEQFSGWLEASQIAKPPPPEDGPITNILAGGNHFTRTRDPLISDEDWYNHPTVQQYRIERGIDDFLYSIYPLCDGEMCSAIGLYRHVGREKFSASDRRITHIVLSNVPWLHAAESNPFAETMVPTLTPAQRIVLIYLLNGKRRPEIARLLRVAETTVKDHTRAILRHFDVPDQLALVCKLRTGNGLDAQSDGTS